MRWLLALPGWLVDRLDGEVVESTGATPEDVLPLVQQSAEHPESRLALEDGLHYHVDAPLVVAYQTRGRTAFAIGGLNAPAGERAGLLRGFLALTEEHGLKRQLIFPLRDHELPEAREARFAPVQVGVEGVLDLPDLTFAGSRYAHVRGMRNRAHNKGVQLTWYADPAPVAEELAALHGSWLASKRPSWRMKLLVGSPSLHRPADRRYLVARTDRGVEGFVTVLPGAPGHWGLDVMCRRPDSVAGTMEALLCEVARQLREDGAETLSLGACPMAGVPRQGERRWLREIFHALYHWEIGNHIFSFRSLHRFKQKFHPRWEPVYFAAAGQLGVKELYLGCRMWGLY